MTVMHFKSLTYNHRNVSSQIFVNVNIKQSLSLFFNQSSNNSVYRNSVRFSKKNHRFKFITSCTSPIDEVKVKESKSLIDSNDDDDSAADIASVSVSLEEEERVTGNGTVEGQVLIENDDVVDNSVEVASVSAVGVEEGMKVVEVKVEDLEDQSLWKQMIEIVMFSGPAAGLWICGPLMSLIDTAVIGQGSSIELAALGPGTVLCDYISYAFMFLSIATSNMVAISLAKKDKKLVQHQISIMLFVGFACGMGMLIFTRFFGEWALAAFTGAKNIHIVPAANTYVQIRGLAWPAILVGWVAQSASLGMKDSWGPLKALAVASAVNGIGDIVLCSFMGYGIAGAAWATMVSQVIAGYMMIEALNKRGYNAYAVAVPSKTELFEIFGLAAPVFITMMSKVAFYSLLIYFATSMGTHTVAAHQVMLQVYGMCAVWGEPLSQTAQSFMPELIYGVNRSLKKARRLLKSLLIIGAIFGILLGLIGTFVPWYIPKLFTSDPAVVKEMHQVLIPYFLALSVTSCTHSLEGTLLAGRELIFISISMTACFILGGIVQLLLTKGGYGLPGCWYSLVGFQWARFLIALSRLMSSDSILYSEKLKGFKDGKLTAV